ncbi:putative transcription factor Nin-like family [Rosa chinensis]|uniref:Putative transcription factor Nin-like family n=1 Tax=Rosa chinensis TaxID=74649 RepID=A0A2P6R8I0_ROSCH|nr:putative transcription factor Nin-like family [Rosa chinensis]
MYVLPLAFTMFLSGSEYVPSEWEDELLLTDDTFLGDGFGVGIDGDEGMSNNLNTTSCNTEDRSGIASSSSKPSKAKMLSQETISEYFYMPITRAAEEMNVSVTTLKKRCRELGIHRWPCRKLNSVKNLEESIQISYMQEFGKKEEELEFLEKERKMIEQVPDLQLEEKTKRLRHAYFKAKSCGNYSMHRRCK